MMAAQEERFQGLLSQVMHHVMQMTGSVTQAQTDPLPTASGIDHEMDRKTWSPSASEIAEINADYYQEKFETDRMVGGLEYAEQQRE